MNGLSISEPLRKKPIYPERMCETLAKHLGPEDLQNILVALWMMAAVHVVVVIAAPETARSMLPTYLTSVYGRMLW